MSFKRFFKCGLLILLLGSGLLISCGPSPEEQAATDVALTAAAATDTPIPTPTSTPTPTPTPIPYDLTVLVIGEEDAPINGASIVLTELGEKTGTQITDDTGFGSWHDLPGETVSFTISAQGYLPLNASETMERGANEVTFALERDPFGLLPSEICAPGERLLYVDDFQDGQAQGWRDIEYRANGWDIGPSPDNPDDLVISHTGRSGTWTDYDPVIYEDAVWRFQYMITRPRTFTMHWHIAPEPYEIEDGWVDDSRYQVDFLPRNLYVLRITNPIWAQPLMWSNLWNPTEEWHTVEISTFEDRFEVWRDGKRLFVYTDPSPLPGGGIKIESSQTADPESFVYFNNMSVCELSEPFKPMTIPES